MNEKQGKSSNQSWVLKDQVSPYKISLIVVVEECCRNNHDRQQGNKESLTEAQERKLMLLLLKLVQSADMQLSEMIQKLSDVGNTELVETITERLLNLCSDGDALMDLMLSLPKTLFDEDEDIPRQKEPLLDKPSVLGLFIRRMLLAFNKLTFSQVTNVQADYKLYIQAWKQNSQVDGTALDGTGFVDESVSLITHLRTQDGSDMWEDSVRGQGESSENTRQGPAETLHRHSQRQAEYFIAQQTNLLSHNEAEALSPKQLQHKVTQVLTSNPQLAEAHFLSYMNNLRVNEYCSAMESLYHYFDRQQVLAAPSQSQIVNSKMKVEEEGLSRGFRYAALNLASLQYRFGHRSEALAAIQEAIRMAQESNDNVCLQHALSWLQRLGIQQTGATAYLLDRLVTKSTELNLPYLTSLGIQAFAKHNALSTAKPASVFEFILKSDIVNCQHSLSELMCNSYAQKAALWKLYGNREMCLLQCQLMLNLNTSELGVYHNAEAECLALCHLTTIHANQGEYNLATDIMAATKTRFPTHCQYSTLWMECEQQLLFYRAIRQSNWSLAEQAVANLKNVNSVEANYCQCILHKDKGETTLALELIQKLLKECEKNDGKALEKPHLYVRLLLVQSELLCATDNQTSSAEPLLQCITLCAQHHYTHLAALTTLHLAFVQHCVGMPSQALSLLDSVLLQVLSHSSVLDKARALYLWVRCTVSSVKNQPKDHRHKVLSSCVQMLTDVISLFRECESILRVKDVLYYQARLYHALGYKAERNKCALEFNQLDQQWPSWHATTVCVL